MLFDNQKKYFVGFLLVISSLVIIIFVVSSKFATRNNNDKNSNILHSFTLSNVFSLHFNSEVSTLSKQGLLRSPSTNSINKPVVLSSKQESLLSKGKETETKSNYVIYRRNLLVIISISYSFFLLKYYLQILY